MSKTLKQTEQLRHFIETEAKTLGFDLCRITSAEKDDHAAQNLKTFVKKGHHGTMEWMAETVERRSSPNALWPEAKSIIMLAVNYAPHHDPLEVLQQPNKGAISVYAQNRDYHDIIKGRLKTLASKFAAKSRQMNIEGAEVKVFVDTAPVMEKPLAARAGLGWQGKHTNLVSQSFGSWLFLGSIFTTLELPPNERESDHCGSCKNCLTHCPTNAFTAPYQIDARRCISYLTIEHKSPIPHELRPLMGNRIYGCDDCLAACPWNKFAQSSNELKLKSREELKAPDLDFLASLDDKDFRKFFSGSPVKRIGRERFIRNVLIAMGNSKNEKFLPKIFELLHEESPNIRGAAIWAAGEINSLKIKQKYQIFSSQETDENVLKEWQLILEKK